MAPLDGHVPFATGFPNPHAHTSQVLNQCHPQHERQRPEFTDFQRTNRLVGRNKAIEAICIDTAIDVSDQLQCNAINPWSQEVVAILYSGQFAAERRGKQSLDGMDLLLNKVEIIQKPFRSGLDCSTFGGRRNDQVIGFGNQPLVLCKPL